MDRVAVDLGERKYSITVGWGYLGEVGKMAADLGVGNHMAIVTNPSVKRLYGRQVSESLRGAGIKTFLIEVPDGERYKTMKWVGHIHDRLVREKCERGSCLMALGGGVIGDMTGFAAATFLRGISYIQVPTTLAAQVDASIGGKTGVNHPRGKNLIGAFYQPRAVFIDLSTLSTLKRREFLSGMAEVVKYGVIADEGFFSYVEKNAHNVLALEQGVLLNVVKRSCEIKAAVIQKDERESGERRILNYGHTIGHALEAATDYRKYLHGEAVAIGMAAAARLSRVLGLCDEATVTRQVQLLRAFSLPTIFPRVEKNKLLAAMEHDKKVKGGNINCVLAEKIGHVCVRSVEKEAIRVALWN